MTEELKRCPFCGGTANIAKGRIEFWAYCPHCGAQIELCETKQEAVKAWNARPIENELEAENARLREALEEIKNNVKEAQDPVYSFHFDLDSKHGAFILEIAEKALTTPKIVWRPKNK